MNKNIILLGVIFILCASFVMAVPRIPVQVFGNVEGINNGTQLIVKINGIDRALSTVNNNKLGVSSLIFLAKDDPNTNVIEGITGNGNDIIGFKFSGYNVIERRYTDPKQEIFFVNLRSSELQREPQCNSNSDCSVGYKCAQHYCEKITGTRRSGGGGGGSSHEFVYPYSNEDCITQWVCTSWSECVNNIQTRKCIKEDENCNDTSFIPPTKIACGEVESTPIINDNSFENKIIPPPKEYYPDDTTKSKPQIEEESGFSWWYILLLIILLLILMGLGFVYYEYLIAKKESGENYVDDPVLDKYVRDTLKKGFTKDEIRAALIKKGWSRQKINDYFFHHPELKELSKNGNKKLSNPIITSMIKKKKNHEQREKELDNSLSEISKDTSTRIKIKKYVNLTLKKGFTRAEIKKALLKAGWKEDIIDKYLYEDLKEGKVSLSEKIKSKGSSSKVENKTLPLNEQKKDNKKIIPDNNGKSTNKVISSKINDLPKAKQKTPEPKKVKLVTTKPKVISSVESKPKIKNGSKKVVDMTKVKSKAKKAEVKAKPKTKPKVKVVKK